MATGYPTGAREHRHDVIPRQIQHVRALQTQLRTGSRTVVEIDLLHQQAQIWRGELPQVLLERVGGKS